MTYDDVVDYFNQYVKPYLPYQYKDMYSVLIDYLAEKYFAPLYTETPSEFISLYEENEIISSIYDQLLTAIGVHDEVIQNLTINEKVAFLKSLSDFQRYKGSVSMFQKVGDAFTDKINIYELYVDYSDQENAWILKPYQIYKGDTYPEIDQLILYEDVYNKLPNLLISTEQLDSIKNDNNSVFPLKTNLMLLDYNLFAKSSPMINLVISTILKEYGTMAVTLYMRDGTYELTLKDLFFTWYYIVSLYHGGDWCTYNITELLLFSENDNPYSLSDLPNIFSLYNKIDSGYEASEIYKEYFETYFKTLFRNNSVNKDDLKTTLKSINENFCSYIHSRIDGLEGSYRTREFNSILNELYNSFLLVEYENRKDEYFIKYYDEYFLQSLPNILYDPKETTTYIILYNFKPFHVDFITRYRESIISDDKFDNVNPAEQYPFLLEMVKADFLDEIQDVFDFGLSINKELNITIESVVNTNIGVYDYNNKITTGDNSNSLVVQRVVHTEDIVDRKQLATIVSKKPDVVDLISIIKYNMCLNYLYNLNPRDNQISKTFLLPVDVMDITDQFKKLNINFSQEIYTYIFDHFLSNTFTIKNDENLLNDTFRVEV